MNTRAATSLPGARQVLTELAAFLRRPDVRSPEGLRSASSWKTFGVLFALHVAVLLLLTLPLTALIQSLLGLAPPDAFDQVPKHWLIPITVVIAPILEEILFRSWQSGRPRALWLLLCGLLVGATLTASMHGLGPLLAGGLLLALALAGAIGWYLLRRHGTLQAYRRAFPAIYWIVAIGFAGVHVLNYGDASALTALLVLPQLWAGVMLGYTRQKLGVGAGMLQHAGANAIAIGLSLIAGL